MKANGHHSLQMELDTGSVVSIVNEKTYLEKFSDRTLRLTNLKLQDYNKAAVVVLGVIDAPVVYKSQSATLPLHVEEGRLTKSVWQKLVVQVETGLK